MHASLEDFFPFLHFWIFILDDLQSKNIETQTKWNELCSITKEPSNWIMENIKVNTVMQTEWMNEKHVDIYRHNTFVYMRLQVNVSLLQCTQFLKFIFVALTKSHWVNDN